LVIGVVVKPDKRKKIVEAQKMHEIFNQVKAPWHKGNISYRKTINYEYFKVKWSTLTPKQRDEMFLFELKLYDFLSISIIHAFYQQNLETIGEMKDFFFSHSSDYILNNMDNMGKRNIQYLAMFMLEFYPEEFEKSDKKIEIKVPRKKIKPYDVFYI
tara:strand:+ start:89 stop:559 length:471 start_codon:yes stop_codon:yes gene_type:complete